MDTLIAILLVALASVLVVAALIADAVKATPLSQWINRRLDGTHELIAHYRHHNRDDGNL